MATKPKPKHKARRPVRTPPPRRPRQTSIPGTEGPRILELDRAAEAYVDVRNERMELTEREVAARSGLGATMRKHGQTVYRVDGDEPLIVTLLEGEAKVQVRREKPKAAGDAGEAAA